MIEVWKDIIGYEGNYQISNLGRFKKLQRITWWTDRWGNPKSRIEPEIIKHKFYIRKSGYCEISLSKNGKAKIKFIHQLVAEHFLIKAEHHRIINHKDCDKLNNSITNLEWCTYSHNTQHAYNNGILKRGKDNKRSKQVGELDSAGKIVKTWGSIGEVARDGLGRSGVSSVCNGRNKHYMGKIYKFI